MPLNDIAHQGGVNDLHDDKIKKKNYENMSKTWRHAERRLSGDCVNVKNIPVSAAASALLFLWSFDFGVLLVLVLGDQVADILVGLLELHLVHALALVPVEEGLALVHRAELGGQALEDALERGRVGHERERGLVVRGRALNHAGLLVVRPM